MTAGRPVVRLSAHALDRREGCERRFVLEYGDRLRWPAETPADALRGERTGQADDRSPAALGQAFHKLVQRHRLGMEVRPAGELGRLWEAFARSPHFAVEGEAWTEQVLQFALPGRDGAPVSFEVRFDEVRRLSDGTWRILDWKTGHLPGESELENRWQSRLYRFVLAFAGQVLSGGDGVPPQSIKLVYWLVRKSEGRTLSYDAVRFDRDRQALLAIAEAAAVPLDQAASPSDPARCSSCPFDSFCHFPATPQVEPRALALPRFVL